jgi:hypothetical protein
MDKNGRHKRPDHSNDFSRNAKYFRPTRRGRVPKRINRSGGFDPLPSTFGVLPKVSFMPKVVNFMKSLLVACVSGNQ